MSVSATVSASNGDAAACASGSSFYMAMRILPMEQRNAMYAIYDFCRNVDDIADDTECDSADRLMLLACRRREVDAVYDGAKGGLFGRLAIPIRRFGLRREDFHAVIEGMEIDAGRRMVAPSLEALDFYCDCVASAVGRLSVRVFGVEDAAGIALAHHLGRALQLTNILRDVDEDAAMGRLYLPRESLEDAGIIFADIAEALEHPRIDDACRTVARWARDHYVQADAIMDTLPAAQVRAPRIMRVVYGAILKKLEQRGWRGARPAVGLGKLALGWSIVRYGLLK